MRIRYLFGALTALCLSPCAALADGGDGNRYSGDPTNLPREYRADISAASAYIQTLTGRRHHGQRHDGHGDHEGYGRHGGRAVIIDVRTIEEYVGGHPPRAISIPFPHIYNRQNDPAKGDYIGQDPEAFVEAVDNLDLPKDTLIITMCRTGYRSVLAANLLADAGYTNAQNMWEGFVGRLKQNLTGEDLDLDGNGVVDGSDPYSGDRDGWANYQGLPVSMRLVPRRLYAPYMSLYYSVPGER